MIVVALPSGRSLHVLAGDRTRCGRSTRGAQQVVGAPPDCAKCASSGPSAARLAVLEIRRRRHEGAELR